MPSRPRCRRSAAAYARRRRSASSNACAAIKGERVGIGRLERFVADYCMAATVRREASNRFRTGIKVAVIGSGPAGLTCAGDLARSGLRCHDLRGAAYCPAACWSTASPSSVCPRPLSREEIDSARSAGRQDSRPIWSSASPARSTSCLKTGYRGRLHRLRRRSAQLYEHPGREPARASIPPTSS